MIFLKYFSMILSHEFNIIFVLYCLVFYLVKVGKLVSIHYTTNSIKDINVKSRSTCISIKTILLCMF